MKRTITFLFLLSGLLSAGKEKNQVFALQCDKNPRVSFTENKGQVRDLNSGQRPDILFGGSSGAMAFHLRKNGISYQLNKVTAYKKLKQLHKASKKRHLPEQVAAETKIFRADVQWLNANESAAIEYDSQLDGVSHFYNRSNPEGIRDVRSFTGVWYKNIYANTDLHYYSTASGIKYDFIVSPGGNYKDIKMALEGFEQIKIKKDGSVFLKTPFGDIVEEAPVVFQDNKKLNAKWVLTGRILSFDIENYDANRTLIIDPITRLWGTYYGGVNGDIFLSIATDASNNVIAAGASEGATGTVIATTGSHLQTYGGGTFDAIIAKFNSGGVRQWATYYGDAGEEFSQGCATDPSGNIIATGYSDGVAGPALATSGCFQSTYGGGAYDGFVVKFNASGTRLWGTYYGSTGDDEFVTTSTDNSGNIFVGGGTDSNTGITTSGAHQSTFGGSFDVFLVKFDPLGARLWCTYYGGSGDESITGCDANATGDIYICGGTNSSGASVIATSSAHQSILAGQEDGYLVKFNSTGVRQWGTYVGGASFDFLFGTSVDGTGNVNVIGDSESTSGISTTGAHQLTYAGGMGDAFVAKFSPAGVRLWSTYYGGNAYDDSYGCASDQSGNVYLAGTTETNGGNAIATASSFQSTFGGNSDCYLVKFSATGVRLWGTYYGGTGDEVGWPVADAAGDVYLGGLSDSSNGTAIASSNGHQPTNGGSFDGFIAKFGGCTMPAPATIVTTNLSVCSNKSATLVASGPGTAWYTIATGGTAVAMSNTFLPGILPAGTYTFYAEAFDCMPSNSRTAVSLTVVPTPTLQVASSNTAMCVGESAILTVSGASTYTWASLGQSNTVTVSPTSSTTYTVAGGVPGCITTHTYTQIVSICTQVADNTTISSVIQVFPNPTTGRIVIKSSKDTEAQVMDVLGRRVSISLNTGENVVQLPVEKGLYFIRVNEGDQVTTIKVLKE